MQYGWLPVAARHDSSQFHSLACDSGTARLYAKAQADDRRGGPRAKPGEYLEDANVKIGDVLTDVFGLSGQLMLEALVKGLDGEGQPSGFDIAQLARGHARKKLDQLRLALEGHQMRNAHRILILHTLRHMAFQAEETEALDQNIATLIREANLIEAYQLLQTIPGIRFQAAATILAESGPDMKQFPTGAKFSSWSGVAPGNNESVGRGSGLQR
jgi:transposase